MASRLGAHRMVSADFSVYPSHQNEVRLRIAPGIEAMLDRAWQLGHRAFAMLYADAMPIQWSHMERFRTFVKFCQERELAVDPACLVEIGWSPLDAYRATQRLLDARPDVTLLFAVTDVRAMGVLHALEDRGLAPGKDVSVLGFDDIPEAEELGLASVHVPHDLIGLRAVELMDRVLEERLTNQRVWVETTAQPRATLGPAPEGRDASEKTMVGRVE